MNHRGLYMFLLRFLTPAGRLFFWVRYHGVRNIPPNGKLIVCSNHKSVVDPFLIAMPFRRNIHYMAKSELFTDHGPLARTFLYAMGAFPVNRNTGDMKSMRTAEHILKSGGIVGIFPQGKCVFDGSPFCPKAGFSLLAARSGAPVLPVAISCRGVLRPFKSVSIRFGHAVPCSSLPIHGTSASGMRKAAAEIAAQINAMLEEKA